MTAVAARLADPRRRYLVQRPAAPGDLAHASRAVRRARTAVARHPGQPRYRRGGGFFPSQPADQCRTDRRLAQACRRPVVVLGRAALAADRPRYGADGIEPAGGSRPARVPASVRLRRAARCTPWCSSTCHRSSAITLSPENPTSYIPITARGKFLDVCAGAGVKVIACGHKHVYRKVRHRGMDIVWAPATAMVDVKHPLARRGSFPRPGYLEWRLSPQRRVA